MQNRGITTLAIILVAIVFIIVFVGLFYVLLWIFGIFGWPGLASAGIIALLLGSPTATTIKNQNDK